MKLSKVIGVFSFFIIALFLVIISSNHQIVHVYATNDTNDTTAPVTSISFESEEWMANDIEIEFECVDDFGCSITKYCVDEDNECSPNLEYSSKITHVDQGTFYVRFNSVDTSNNIEEVKSQVLNLDKTNPEVIILDPINGAEIEGLIYIIKGEASDLISPIDQVEIFIDGEGKSDTLGKNSWQYEWEGLVDGQHEITAVATDSAGNTAEMSIEIAVDNPPSARIISLGNPPLVTSGRIEVEVQTSEEVQLYPTLSYSFPGEGGIQIPLEGSKQNWRGFMIITEDDQDKIGTFSFSAKDFENNVGSQITQGSFFIVDSNKPGKVTDVNVEVDGDNVKIKWHYEGEKLKQFNIYRSETPNVDYTDYYKSINSEADYTIDDLNGKRYYYRIAAVDGSDNLGELSEEVDAAAEEKEELEQTNSNTQNIEKKSKISQSTIESIDFAVEEINFGLSEISKAKLVLERDLVAQEFGLITKLENGRKSFEGFRVELNNLKSEGKDSEVINKIQKILGKAEEILGKLPKSIVAEDQSSYVQEVGYSDIENVVDTIKPGLDEKGIDKYVVKSQKLQEKVEVKTEYKVYKVQLMEGEEYITYLKKEITSSLFNPSSFVIESIPKSVASSMSEVMMITQGYEVLKDDPIIKWDSDIFEIKYYVENKVSPEEIKKAKTLVLLEDQENAGITGFAVIDGAKEFIFDIKGILTLVALALIITGFFYAKGNNIQLITKKSYPTHLSYKKTEKKSNLHNRINDSELKRYYHRLTPVQKNQANKIAHLNVNDFERHFHEISEKANFYIDNINFGLASKSYSLMIELYKRLEKKNKEREHKEIITVYNKLNLYSKIKELHTQGKMNQNLDLNNLLEHVSGLYSLVASSNGIKDTKLTRFCREYHEFALNKVNNRKISSN